MRHHMKFLQNGFIIWAARLKHLKIKKPLKNRSKLIKELLKNNDEFNESAAHYWYTQKSAKCPLMKRTYIWHDTDTSISLHTPNVFIDSVFSQLFYGAKFVSEFLPTTDFDIDPNAYIISPEIELEMDHLLNKLTPYYNPHSTVEYSTFKKLQKAFIRINDQIQMTRYHSRSHFNDLKIACELIKLAKQTIRVLAKINPNRFGPVKYLINHLSITLVSRLGKRIRFI